jgi:hypothetical protein
MFALSLSLSLFLSHTHSLSLTHTYTHGSIVQRDLEVLFLAMCRKKRDEKKGNQIGRNSTKEKRKIRNYIVCFNLTLAKSG